MIDSDSWQFLSNCEVNLNRVPSLSFQKESSEACKRSGCERRVKDFKISRFQIIFGYICCCIGSVNGLEILEVFHYILFINHRRSKYQGRISSGHALNVTTLSLILALKVDFESSFQKYENKKSIWPRSCSSMKQVHFQLSWIRGMSSSELEHATSGMTLWHSML